MRRHQAIFLLCGFVTLAAIGHAATQPKTQAPVKVAIAKPATLAKLSALQAVRLQPQVVALRSNARTLAARQPDFAKRVNLGAIDQVRVPVLVQPAQLQTVRVITRPDHFTTVSQVGNATVTLDGTATAQPLAQGRRLAVPGTRIALRTLKAPNVAPVADTLDHVRVEHTISGVSMSFVRFGHLYDLTIDCPDAGAGDPESTKPDADDLARIKKQFGSAPKGPPQCTPENAVAIAKQLEVLGGGAP